MLNSIVVNFFNRCRCYISSSDSGNKAKKLRSVPFIKQGRFYFLVEDTTWPLRYLVVDTRKWLPGRPVLLAPAWVSLVEWADRKVSVNLTSEQVKSSPEYESAESVTADYEHRLHQHYGLPIEKGLGPL